MRLSRDTLQEKTEGRGDNAVLRQPCSSFLPLRGVAFHTAVEHADMPNKAVAPEESGR